MKGRVMKRAIFKCWPALLVVFCPVICRGGVVILASTGGVTLSGADEHVTISSEDDLWDTKSTRYRIKKAGGGWANPIGERDGFSAMDAADTAAEQDGPTVGFSAESKKSDAPSQRYLLITVVGGATGLALIAAGAVQWWRHRSLRQNWLFPMVQDEGESAELADSLPGALIAKKQIQSPQDEETEKPARRRAA
jgi:hypothetical protein